MRFIGKSYSHSNFIQQFVRYEQSREREILWHQTMFCTNTKLNEEDLGRELYVKHKKTKCAKMKTACHC